MSNVMLILSPLFHLRSSVRYLPATTSFTGSPLTLTFVFLLHDGMRNVRENFSDFSFVSSNSALLLRGNSVFKTISTLRFLAVRAFAVKEL